MSKIKLLLIDDLQRRKEEEQDLQKMYQLSFPSQNFSNAKKFIFDISSSIFFIIVSSLSKLACRQPVATSNLQLISI